MWTAIKPQTIDLLRAAHRCGIRLAAGAPGRLRMQMPLEVVQSVARDVERGAAELWPRVLTHVHPAAHEALVELDSAASLSLIYEIDWPEAWPRWAWVLRCRGASRTSRSCQRVAAPTTWADQCLREIGG
jgi:hypothetical protein